MIKARQQISGKLGYNTINVYPHLEDLKVEPTLEGQTFKSKLYGYDNVTVERIKTEDISVTPTRKEQNFDGIYNKVNVKAIEENSLDVTPSLEQQSFDGVYTEVNVDPINGENIVIDPKNEQQTFSGIYTDITVNEIQGDTLDITPSTQSQSFEGVYETVNVNPITGDNLNITPTTKEQSFTGVYTEVNVDAITGDTLNITPTTSEQTHEGVYTTVNVDPITGEEITITPSATKQVKEGLYSKVTVTGDSNLVAENIAKDVTIFGVTGTHEGGNNPAIELPEGITQVEYIQGSASSPIFNTGYRHKANTNVEAQFMQLSGGGIWWVNIFGARNVNFQSAAFTFFSKFTPYAVEQGPFAFCRTGSEVSVDGIFDTKVTVTTNGLSATFTDGNITRTLTTTGVLDNGVNDFFLLGVNAGGPEDIVQGSGSTEKTRLYYLKIFEGDVLLHHYIACKTNDGRAGFYDLIDKKLITVPINEVIVGEEATSIVITPSTEKQVKEGLYNKVIVEPITGYISESEHEETVEELQEVQGLIDELNGGYEPGAYSGLKYLQNTAFDKYISTGIGVSDKVEIDIKYNLIANKEPNLAIPFGARYAAHLDAYIFFAMAGENMLFIHYGDTEKGMPLVHNPLNTDYRVVMGNNMFRFYNDDGLLYENDYSDLGVAPFDRGDTAIALYACRGDFGYTLCSTKMKLYYCKIKKNGVLVRDFVPMRRNSDGMCGLFDMVTKTFFTSADGGINDFTGELLEGVSYDSSGNEAIINESDKLFDINYALETKRLMKETLISKGVTISDTDTFRSYVDKINRL